jgi:hypothetical protein
MLSAAAGLRFPLLRRPVRSKEEIFEQEYCKGELNMAEYAVNLLDSYLPQLEQQIREAEREEMSDENSEFNANGPGGSGGLAAGFDAFVRGDESDD